MKTLPQLWMVMQEMAKVARRREKTEQAWIWMRSGNCTMTLWRSMAWVFQCLSGRNKTIDREVRLRRQALGGWRRWWRCTAGEPASASWVSSTSTLFVTPQDTVSMTVWWVFFTPSKTMLLVTLRHNPWDLRNMSNLAKSFVIRKWNNFLLKAAAHVCLAIGFASVVAPDRAGHRVKSELEKLSGPGWTVFCIEAFVAWCNSCCQGKFCETCGDGKCSTFTCCKSSGSLGAANFGGWHGSRQQWLCSRSVFEWCWYSDVPFLLGWISSVDPRHEALNHQLSSCFQKTAATRTTLRVLCILH